MQAELQEPEMPSDRSLSYCTAVLVAWCYLIYLVFMRLYQHLGARTVLVVSPMRTPNKEPSFRIPNRPEGSFHHEWPTANVYLTTIEAKEAVSI